MRSSQIVALLTLVILSAYLSSVNKSATTKTHSPLRQPATSSVKKNTAEKPVAASAKSVILSQAKASEQIRAEFDKQKAQVEKVSQCYITQDCPYPETDPRSYSFAVALDLQMQLRVLRDKYIKYPEFEETFRDLAHDSLQILDGHVQSAALDILTQIPTSEKTREAIIQALQNNPDPEIVSQAMDQLQRYLGSHQEESVHRALQKIVGYGPQFSSEMAARSLMGFINARSFEGYLKLSRQLPPTSAAGQTLKTYLQEYQRQQNGG